MSLSQPIIHDPLYVDGQAVGVTGYVLGNGIRVKRYDRNGVETEIGHVPRTSRLNVSIVLTDPLDEGDRVYAIQYDRREASPPVSQQYAVAVQAPPDCVRADQGTAEAVRCRPRIRLPLYKCAQIVWFSSIVHGATVHIQRRPEEASVEGPEVGWEDVYRPYPWGLSGGGFWASPPLEEREQLRIRQTLGSWQSEWSVAEELVQEYQGQLDPPTIPGPLIECAPSFLVEETEPTALVLIWREDSGYTGPRDEPFLKAFAEGSSADVEVEGGLQQGWVLSATQELCGEEEDRSEKSPQVSVMPIEYLEEYLEEYLGEREQQPVYLDMASRLVEVDSLHEITLSLVGITPDGAEEEIARTTSAGRTRFHVNLEDPDTPIEEVYPEVRVVHSLQCRSEATGQVVTRAVPSEPVPTERLLVAEPLDLEEQNQVVNAHNACRERFRRTVGLSRTQCPNLVWSDELAYWAQLYANQLAVDDPAGVPPYEVSHSDRDTQRADRRDGENIAWSLAAVADFVAFIETEWCEGEGGLYFDDGQPRFPLEEEEEEINWRAWGHYTQIVWSDTYAVGCGRAQSESGRRYWVCQYRLGGNMRGEWPHGQDPSTL
jgi:pathogenesis-related protein 1